MMTYYIRLMWFGLIGSRWGCFVNADKPRDKELERRLKLNVHPLLRCFCSVKWKQEVGNV